MGAGVLPGLQNRWAFAAVKVGGFDSHTLPPISVAGYSTGALIPDISERKVTVPVISQIIFYELFFPKPIR